jgi:hypothetical protein
LDNRRFDRLSRHVGAQTSRRGAFKAAAGGALALVGLGAVSRKAAAQTGLEGDSCLSTADCRAGLECRGASSGLLGGLLAGQPYGPPGITDSPPFAPSTGVCRFRNNCSREGQACNRNDDCCDGLECNNNRCRNR